jgi:hypothetical protein
MLLTISLLFGMLIAWLAVTALFIVLWVYRAVIGLREEEVLYIDPGEEHLRRDQRETTAKIERVRPYLITTFVLVVVLGLATFGLWVYQQLVSPTP